MKNKKVIKPCPFCGIAVKCVPMKVPERVTKRWEIEHRCSSDMYLTVNTQTRINTINQWNKREVKND